MMMLTKNKTIVSPKFLILIHSAVLQPVCVFQQPASLFFGDTKSPMQVKTHHYPFAQNKGSRLSFS
jgi:hypothetical protein